MPPVQFADTPLSAMPLALRVVLLCLGAVAALDISLSVRRVLREQRGVTTEILMKPAFVMALEDRMFRKNLARHIQQQRAPHSATRAEQ